MKKLILLLSIITIATSVDIECSYSVVNYYTLSQIYSCVIQTVSSPENPTVHISGSHMSGKNNDNVQGLYGNIGNVQKFPRDIHRTFKNLIAIYFTGGQIKELVADDLKPFPDLMEMYFDNNQIEVVEEGTFYYNPKLVGVSFFYNKLIHISSNVFDHLSNLSYLWLNGNPCENSAATNNRNAVLGLIAVAKASCQSPTILRYEHLLKGQKYSPDIARTFSNSTRSPATSSDIDKKIENLKARMDVHDQNLIELKAEVLKKFDDFEINYQNKHSELMHSIEQKLKSLMKCNGCD
ncbi:SLIT and NTRK-like protein 6 [Chironomus tepperi]|uniref:SLIT and NTRK-like protein 6 n=1 Tax=Chironomus tepperi TaxID=113505 RepID=UPI00391FAE4F